MNKEIEVVLNYLKDEKWDYYPADLIPYKVLLMEERDILLSYIEQLEKRIYKAIKYIERLDKDYDINVYQEDKHWAYILYILKGDSE